MGETLRRERAAHKERTIALNMQFAQEIEEALKRERTAHTEHINVLKEQLQYKIEDALEGGRAAHKEHIDVLHCPFSQNPEEVLGGKRAVDKHNIELSGQHAQKHISVDEPPLLGIFSSPVPDYIENLTISASSLFSFSSCTKPCSPAHGRPYTIDPHN